MIFYINTMSSDSSSRFSRFKTLILFFVISLIIGLSISGVLLAAFYSNDVNNSSTTYMSIPFKKEIKYQKFYDKILRRADILETKNSQLHTPLYIDDLLSCMRNDSFEDFKKRADNPQQAFNGIMQYCSFQDFAQQIEDTRKREYEEEKLQNLHSSMHSYNNLSVPESVINEILNKKNWNAATQTLLGNQQGITHNIQNQQTNDLKILGIDELIGVGLSTYYHSSWSRKTNLRNAASKLDGKIIHPGESISMVNTLSPFTGGNGYVSGIIILEGKDVKAIGGGVCQSVTTMFRAWQNSGLEVTKFQPHSKSISYYGGIGFDATMYKSASSWGSVDLLLKNNTNQSILIKVIDREPYQAILLYGTKERKVSLSRYAFNRYAHSQVAKWKRSIEYNNSGEWVDNYFTENQKY